MPDSQYGGKPEEEEIVDIITDDVMKPASECLRASDCSSNNSCDDDDDDEAEIDVKFENSMEFNSMDHADPAEVEGRGDVDCPDRRFLTSGPKRTSSGSISDHGTNFSESSQDGGDFEMTSKKIEKSPISSIRKSKCYQQLQQSKEWLTDEELSLDLRTRPLPSNHSRAQSLKFSIDHILKPDFRFAKSAGSRDKAPVGALPLSRDLNESLDRLQQRQMITSFANCRDWSRLYGNVTSSAAAAAAAAVAAMQTSYDCYGNKGTNPKYDVTVMNRINLESLYLRSAAAAAAATAAAASKDSYTGVAAPVSGASRRKLKRHNSNTTSSSSRLNFISKSYNSNNNNNNNTDYCKQQILPEDGVCVDRFERRDAATLNPKSSSANQAVARLENFEDPRNHHHSDGWSAKKKRSSISSNSSPQSSPREEIGDEAARTERLNSRSSDICSPGGGSGSHDDHTSTSSKPAMPWPAWVYCTRYSDRPSSGTIQ